MIDPLEELKGVWTNERRRTLSSAQNIERIIRAAQKKKKNSIRMHVFNILILMTVLVGIGLFFYYVATLAHVISHIGIALMMGGLACRILIEGYSIYFSMKIDLSETSFCTNHAFLRFYQFRKRIHGPVTITILVLYTIGFYLLTPEFSLFFSPHAMVLIDLSYIAGALIVGVFISKAIIKEMAYLNEIRRLQDEIMAH